ncbi:MAG: prepilin-type N-terminal cleavage/methylation domain-containing protein [gamma proteobacterium symbiont of Bathyaustriella thionipta]|nr:prepilin-type N-terminal cleavage/methylation domain-containing protein [gamma proteobacterium symbiont of Bathyaustriella thionipta]MCU7951721.1 prepilin-type N-terminal cleavage/methylation domain-containing protein [gamma proteobacterium symbiont of Bathyaustriella thionipta]MCU7952340.1 prepilin-type N-terminal cleavage/methylation domain-containing protein [gamma proteobacterium symbiont of Bathyaustriella thionipta]MCU7958322.1 prepilin-type N-terminal cleavage/methylation domain-contai
MNNKTSVGQRRSRLCCNQGFSLIEIMIVVLIIGISASMAVLYIDNSDDRLKSEAKRLLGMTQLVRDDAIITGRSLAMIVERTNYYFSFLENGKWLPLSAKPFKKITVSDDIQLRFILSDKRDDSSKQPANLFYFLPTGETSEFQVWISNADTQYHLSSTPLGELSLKRMEL